MQRQISIPNTPKKGVKGPQPITSPVENTGSTGIRIAPGVRGTRSVGNTFRGLGTGIEVGANATLDSDGDKFHGNRDAIRSEDADVTVRDVTID